MKSLQEIKESLNEANKADKLYAKGEKIGKALSDGDISWEEFIQRTTKLVPAFKAEYKKWKEDIDGYQSEIENERWIDNADMNWGEFWQHYVSNDLKRSPLKEAKQKDVTAAKKGDLVLLKKGNVRGKVESTDGTMLVVKLKDGSKRNVNLNGIDSVISEEAITEESSYSVEDLFDDLEDEDQIDSMKSAFKKAKLNLKKYYICKDAKDADKFIGDAKGKKLLDDGDYVYTTYDTPKGIALAYQQHGDGETFYAIPK